MVGSEFWEEYFVFIRDNLWEDCVNFGIKLVVALGGRHYKVMMRTGPAALCLLDRKFRSENNNKNKYLHLIAARYIGLEKIYEKNKTEEQVAENPYAIMVHLKGKSWTNGSTSVATGLLWDRTPHCRNSNLSDSIYVMFVCILYKKV